MGQKKSTGIDMLDLYLHGGLPRGSVVFFCANPESMSEIFLYHFAAAQRAYYFATDRSPKYIKQNILDFGLKTDDINFIDIYGQYHEGGENVIDHFTNELGKLRKVKDFTCVIDTFSFFLEQDISYSKMKELVDLIYDITKETDSISYLYVLKGVHDEKIMKSISNTCDVIFDIETRRDGDMVSSTLLIPKVRGTFPAPTQLIKYEIQDGIRIDTSVYIA